jgi:hypothetical protein
MVLAGFVPACGTDVPPPPDLPAQPVLIEPLGGAQVTSDTPVFKVQNAKGFDSGQAQYTFVITNASGTRTLQTFTIPAGAQKTAAIPPSKLPRSLNLTWSVTARGPQGTVTSPSATFRTPAVACVSGRDPYAKAVVDWFVPDCSLAVNLYNDPNEVLGRPDAGGQAPDDYFGFLSLGDTGYVTVDTETCAVDQPGNDVRIYQTTGREPVTLYASGSPDGPFTLVGSRVGCGLIDTRLFSHYCDFDLAEGGLEEARYFKIEDGEHYPCPGDTPTEGADIDAIQILHPKP